MTPPPPSTPGCEDWRSAVRRRTWRRSSRTGRASCRSCWISSAAGSLSPTCRASAPSAGTGARPRSQCTRPTPPPCFSAPPSPPPEPYGATAPTCTRRSSSPPSPARRQQGLLGGRRRVGRAHHAGQDRHVRQPAGRVRARDAQAGGRRPGVHDLRAAPRPPPRGRRHWPQQQRQSSQWQGLLLRRVLRLRRYGHHQGPELGRRRRLEERRGAEQVQNVILLHPGDAQGDALLPWTRGLSRGLRSRGGDVERAPQARRLRPGARLQELLPRRLVVGAARRPDGQQWGAAHPRAEARRGEDGVEEGDFVGRPLPLHRNDVVGVGGKAERRIHVRQGVPSQVLWPATGDPGGARRLRWPPLLRRQGGRAGAAGIGRGVG